ncbi:hypothetical protein EQH57_0462 [Dictyocoela roeselum]|nr:hypothetical protein EQH57_0462 [Dictyocoela roeselum]
MIPNHPANLSHKNSTVTRRSVSTTSNKLHSLKSVYSQLLLFGRISPECVKLNSTRQHSQLSDEDPDFHPRKIEFTHTPAGTNINIQRSFQMLENLEKQNIFKWKEEFY